MDNRYNLNNFEALFKKYLLAGNVKSLSIKNYLSDLRHFLGWLTFYTQTHSISLNDPTNLEGLITIKTIADYKSYLIENRIPIKTINRRLSTLRKFSSFCINQGWLKENPAKKIKNEGLKIKADEINKEEILKSFKNELIKKNLNQKTIKSFLDDIREFLSV